MIIVIRARDGSLEDVEVHPRVDGLFELLMTPVSAYGLAALGDVLRLREIGDGVYKIVKVVERPYVHRSWMIPGTYGASESIYDFGEWVNSRGGKWECIALGFLIIHLPTEAAFAEVLAELNARLARFHGSEEQKRLLEQGPPRFTDEDRGRGTMRIFADPKPEKEK